MCRSGSAQKKRAVSQARFWVDGQPFLYPITGELPVTCQESGRLRQVVNALQLVVESWSGGHHERHANAHDVGDWFSEAVPRSSGFPAKAPGLILRELW